MRARRVARVVEERAPRVEPALEGVEAPDVEEPRKVHGVADGVEPRERGRVGRLARGREREARGRVRRVVRLRARLGRERVIQVRFNVSVPRARVPEKASALRDRSER